MSSYDIFRKISIIKNFPKFKYSEQLQTALGISLMLLGMGFLLDKASYHGSFIFYKNLKKVFPEEVGIIDDKAEKIRETLEASKKD